VVPAVVDGLGTVFLMELTHFKRCPTSAIVSPFIETALGSGRISPTRSK
jgi:hypothetical protein